MDGTDAREAIERYYGALRRGDPLHPFFAGEGTVVKVGIGERLIGPASVAAGLREQTRTTEDWTVESRDLVVGRDDAPERAESSGGFAWFGDDVFLAWTDTERRIRFEFDTRWTGAMARRGDAWRFVEMHVSAPGET